MFSSFPRVGENSILSSVDLGSQSGHGGGRGSNRCASRLNQGGGGGTDFCDKSAIKDDSSSSAHVTSASSRMSTESTVFRTMNSLISCDSVSYGKIWKGSYKSGDPRALEPS